MDSKKQPKQPKKSKSKSKSKKTVPNVVIAERISINLNIKRRAQMIRQAPKPAGIDTSDILNKSYLLQKAIATRTAPQSQTQSINLILDGYAQLEKQQQIRRIDDDIQSFRMKAERGVDSSLVNPAIATLQQLRNIPQKEAPFIDKYDPFLEREYAFDVKPIQPIYGGVLQRVPSQFVSEIREEVDSTRDLQGTAPVPVIRPIAGRPLKLRSAEATTFVADRPEVAQEVSLIIVSQKKRDQQERRRVEAMQNPEPPITAGGGARGRPRRTNIDAGPAIAERQTELRSAPVQQFERRDQGQQESIFGGSPAVSIRMRQTRSLNPEPEQQSQLRAIQSDVYTTDVDFEEPSD